jgi:hypothetical protein
MPRPQNGGRNPSLVGGESSEGRPPLTAAPGGLAPARPAGSRPPLRRSKRSETSPLPTFSSFNPDAAGTGSGTRRSRSMPLRRSTTWARSTTGARSLSACSRRTNLIGRRSSAFQVSLGGLIDQRARNAGISIPSHAMLNRQSTLGGTTVAGSRPASVSSILVARRRAEADKYAA